MPNEYWTASCRWCWIHQCQPSTIAVYITIRKKQQRRIQKLIAIISMEFIRMKCLNPQRIQLCGNPLIHYWQFSEFWNSKQNIFLCYIHCPWLSMANRHLSQDILVAIFLLLLFAIFRFFLCRAVCLSIGKLENLQPILTFIIILWRQNGMNGRM